MRLLKDSRPRKWILAAGKRENREKREENLAARATSVVW